MEEKLINLPAERVVLGGIFQHGLSAYAEVCDILSTDVFTDPVNQVIYKCYKYLFDEKGVENLDSSTLLSSAYDLGDDWVFSRREEKRHLETIINSKVYFENIKRFALQIKKLSIARGLRDSLTTASYEINNFTGKESISDIINVAEKSIFDITNSVYGEEVKIHNVGEASEQYAKNIEQNPNASIGIGSGFGYWDQAIGGGFRRKTVSLVGSRIKVGKSILAINVALNVTKKFNIPVLYLDTEMTIDDHIPRIISNLSYNSTKLPIDEIETGKYLNSKEKKEFFNNSVEELKQLPFTYISVSGKEIEEVLSIIRKWIISDVGHDENGVRNDCLIIYDYLKLMSADKIERNLAEYQLLGFIVTSMHNFSIKYDVPILMFTQLNRDGITRETTDVIAGSDRVLWLVTNFTILKRKTEEEIADNPKYTRKMIPIFSRHGAGFDGGDYINIEFHGKYAKMIEGETRNNKILRENVAEYEF